LRKRLENYPMFDEREDYYGKGTDKEPIELHQPGGRCEILQNTEL
jgi:hypothetical protein